MEYMQLSAFADAQYKQPLRDEQNRLMQPYRFMLNPDALKHQQNFAAAPGQPHGTLSFELVIDTTGLINPKRVNLPAELEHLKAIIYTANAGVHMPNYIKMEWGKHLSFYGKITTMDINYTLFKPDGTPLRAKINFVFNQFLPEV